MKTIKNNFKFIAILASSVLVLSCTDLEIEETDSVFSLDAGSEFTGVSDPAASLTSLAQSTSGMLGNQEAVYALQEVTTDAQLVPTRGTDWGDNGVWRSLHNHSWTATHRDVNNTWDQLNQKVYQASEIIDSRSNASAEIVAQAKFYRAFNMYLVMDMYGQVPFRNVWRRTLMYSISFI